MSGRKKDNTRALINAHLQKHMDTNVKYKWKKQWYTVDISSRADSTKSRQACATAHLQNVAKLRLAALECTVKSGGKTLEMRHWGKSYKNLPALHRNINFPLSKQWSTSTD